MSNKCAINQHLLLDVIVWLFKVNTFHISFRPSSNQNNPSPTLVVKNVVEGHDPKNLHVKSWKGMDTIIIVSKLFLRISTIWFLKPSL
jgi:hypothetical protein